MRKFKSLLLMAVAVAATTFQTSAQELRGGVEAGLNLSRPEFHEAKATTCGFYVGVKGELGLKSATKGWFINGAMLLSSKPMLTKSGFVDYSAITPSLTGKYVEQGSFTPYYLEFPFHIGYKFRIADGYTIYPSAGPYVALGLFGKTTWEGFNADNGEKFTTSYGSPFKNGYKRFDGGVNFAVGVEIQKHFQVNLKYSMGFVENNCFYNRVFSAGVAWMF